MIDAVSAGFSSWALWPSGARGRRLRRFWAHRRASRRRWRRTWRRRHGQHQDEPARRSPRVGPTGGPGAGAGQVLQRPGRPRCSSSARRRRAAAGGRPTNSGWASHSSRKASTPIRSTRSARASSAARDRSLVVVVDAPGCPWSTRRWHEFGMGEGEVEGEAPTHGSDRAGRQSPVSPSRLATGSGGRPPRPRPAVARGVDQHQLVVPGQVDGCPSTSRARARGASEHPRRPGAARARRPRSGASTSRSVGPPRARRLAPWPIRHPTAPSWLVPVSVTSTPPSAPTRRVGEGRGHLDAAACPGSRLDADGPRPRRRRPHQGARPPRRAIRGRSWPGLARGDGPSGRRAHHQRHRGCRAARR